jgi:hypothetical protein
MNNCIGRDPFFDDLVSVKTSEINMIPVQARVSIAHTALEQAFLAAWYPVTIAYSPHWLILLATRNER